MLASQAGSNLASERTLVLAQAMSNRVNIESERTYSRGDHTSNDGDRSKEMAIGRSSPV